MIAGTRLRGGSAHTARGASRFAAQAIGTAWSAGCTGLIVVRMDSGYPWQTGPTARWLTCPPGASPPTPPD